MQKLFLLTLITTILSKNNIRVNTKLKTSYFDTDSTRFNSIQIYSGTGQEKKTEKINLEVNIGYNKLIIGNKDYLNWGIHCDGDISPKSCQIKSKSALNDFYYYKSYHYQKAEFFFKFIEQDVLDVKGKRGVDFDLIYLSDLWPIEEIGVIGFGPKSDFGRYLRELYDDEIYFLIEFYSLEYMKKKKNFELNFIINPAFEKNDVKLEIVFKNKEFYAVEAGLEFFKNEENEIIFEEEKFCFTSVEDVLLFLPNRLIYCKQLLSHICQDPTNCNKNNADFKKSFDIKIKIQDENFIFGYKDYFFIEENGEIGCLFGGLDIEGFQICPENSTFGIGKNFISKFPIILGYKKDLSTDFIILKGNILNEPNYVFWIVLSSLAAIFSVVVIFYVCCCKEEEEDIYDLYIPVGMN